MNQYSLSTATIGSQHHSTTNASMAQMYSFSHASSALRATSHSSRKTTPNRLKSPMQLQTNRQPQTHHTNKYKSQTKPTNNTSKQIKTTSISPYKQSSAQKTSLSF